MTDMIERVARALKRVINARCGLPDDEPWELYKDEAIAAIKALREPTDEMKAVFNDYHKRLYNPASPYRAEHTWQAMIDAALGENKREKHFYERCGDEC